MLTLKQFLSAYPYLARFNNTYTRKSKLGKVYLVRKNRWGDSPSRMLDRRIKIKRSLSTLLNTGRISGSSNPNLISLQLKNISNRGKRKAYAKVIKRAAKNIGRVI